MDPTWRGWLAGVIDGRGNIAIRAWRGRYHYAVVEVGHTDAAFLLRLREIAGVGSVGPAKLVGSRGHLGSWRWTARGDDAAAILTTIGPYLVAQAARARLALALVNTDPAHLAEREALYEQMRHLHRRSPYRHKED